MTSPGIMTGLILAMSRAAGEIAPLMFVKPKSKQTEDYITGRFG